MMTSVRLDKGVFSSNVIFKAPRRIRSDRRGKLERMIEGCENSNGLEENEI
jgi:hypothetical protein